MIHVDNGLMDRLGCPLTGEVQRLKTIHGEEEHPFRIVFVGLKTGSAHVNAVGLDLDGRNYHAIFGTTFLELGVFHLDLRGESWFEFHPESIAKM